MATVKSGTLSANTAAPVTCDAGDRGILVTNTAQSGIIYVSVGGTATVAGDDCYAVCGDRVIDVHGADVALSLISSGTPTYSVEAIS